MSQQQIIDAINSRHVIQFTYEGYSRTVEPFTLGYHKSTGNLVLGAWQVGGYSESDRHPPWRLYDVSKMYAITTVPETFTGDRPGYNPGDRRMSQILATV